MTARVAVLDGGLPAWKAEGYPLDTADVSEDEVDAAAAAARQPGASGRYPAKLQVEYVVSLQLRQRHVQEAGKLGAAAPVSSPCMHA
jgi:3-mercaptopyruvate sulfurtransferase SseA